jgi:hypothetical protein
LRRIDDYIEWLARFETAMQALPEGAKQQSVLAVLDVSPPRSRNTGLAGARGRLPRRGEIRRS